MTRELISLDDFETFVTKYWNYLICLGRNMSYEYCFEHAMNYIDNELDILNCYIDEEQEQLLKTMRMYVIGNDEDY